MPVFLAPLAGITDLPFRALVSGFGAGLVVSEMVEAHRFRVIKYKEAIRGETLVQRAWHFLKKVGVIKNKERIKKGPCLLV